MPARLPAEWEEQDAVLLAWPHADTDWRERLDAVRPVFAAIVSAISRFEGVLLLTQAPEAVRPALEAAGARLDRVRMLPVPTNDTWARDFGPLTVQLAEGFRLVDFGFNGWGLKFPAFHDNQVNRRLRAHGVFGDTPMQTEGLILEGGAIESDGEGTLLTTAECLLNPNRNPQLDQEAIEARLRSLFGLQRVLWLHNGALAGDDTDSHVDTLARLCPHHTILYQACDDHADEHAAPLAAMEAELRAFRTRDGAPYRLLALPWPPAAFGDDGHRLPATYANFLIINGAVLVPTYEAPTDAVALEVVSRAFPDREVIGINCRPLIEQHGSLHCLTMQIPKGVLP